MKYTDEFGMGIYPFVPVFAREEETGGNPRKPAPGKTEEAAPVARRAGPSMPADPFPYDYPQNRSLALQFICEAIAGEAEDGELYARLLRTARGEEERRILAGIRADERKHGALLRKLYFELTGRNAVERARRFAPQRGGTLKEALIGETAAVSKYRKILFAMQERRHVNMLTEILTDEIRHADLIGLLLHVSARR